MMAQRLGATLALLVLFGLVAHADDGESRRADLARATVASGLAKRGVEATLSILEVVKPENHDTVDRRKRAAAALAEVRSLATEEAYAKRAVDLFEASFTPGEAAELADLLSRPVMQKWVAAVREEEEELSRLGEEWFRELHREYMQRFSGLRLDPLPPR